MHGEHCDLYASHMAAWLHAIVTFHLAKMKDAKPLPLTYKTVHLSVDVDIAELRFRK